MNLTPGTHTVRTQLAMVGNIMAPGSSCVMTSGYERLLVFGID